jgi:opacity protein-like surface antigen
VNRRLFFLALSLIAFAPAPARADWLLSPYLGVRFATDTSFVVGFRGAEHSKFTFGSSVGLLTDRGLGIEADVAFVPSFFEGVAVTESRVITLMGNVIVALPLAMAQYGLRPYAVGGIGLLHARGTGDVVDFFDSNLLGINVGGGALGPISDRSSLRFDLRYFRNLSDDDAAAVLANTTRLSFWRATIGLSFRF